MEALEQSVALVNQGSDPNSALAKTASESGFNVEQTRRLSELFNTARTLHHFETNKTEKSASFAIADSDVVLGIMFDDDQSADKYAEEFYDYSEYDQRDPARTDDLDDLFGVGKQAEDLVDIEGQSRRAYRVYDTQISMADQLRSEANQATSIAVDSLSKLAESIWDRDSPEDYALFLHIRPQAAEKVAVHLPENFKPATVKFASIVDSGPVDSWVATYDEADALMFKAAAALTLAEDVVKEATDFCKEFEGIVMPKITKSAAGFDINSYLNEQQSKAKEKSKKKDSKPKAKDAEKNVVVIDGKAKDKAEPKPKKDWAGVISEDPLSLNLPELEAGAVRGTAGLAGKTLNTLGAPASFATKKVKEHVDTSLANLLAGAANARDKKHEYANANSSAELGNAQREIILSELMVTDPFISEDPDAVVSGYTTLMQLAPELSLNKEVTRAILRQMAHEGTLDTFSAKSIADLEKVVRSLGGRLAGEKEEN